VVVYINWRSLPCLRPRGHDQGSAPFDDRLVALSASPRTIRCNSLPPNQGRRTFRSSHGVSLRDPSLQVVDAAPRLAVRARAARLTRDRPGYATARRIRCLQTEGPATGVSGARPGSAKRLCNTRRVNLTGSAKKASVAFAAVAIALTIVVLQTTGADAARPTDPVALVAAHTKFPWKGHDHSCTVQVPTPGAVTYAKYTTCPPKHVLIIGDSLALTMGLQMSMAQEDWGTLIDNVALDGCGFVTGYSIEHLGAYTPMNHSCDNEVATWASDARSFKAQAIVVELGWWDSFDHMINGSAATLLQPQYDDMVEQKILALIAGLRTASAAPIYFLSVPWMDPPETNGQPEPAASAASHNEINALIEQAAKSSRTTHFVDVSPYITPAGSFQTNVDGGICRNSDGVHLYYAPAGTLDYVHTRCGMALQRGVLSLIREDLKR